MRILTSSYTWDFAGVPTYTMTMVAELRRRGHDVAIYSPKGGPVSRVMPCVADPSGFRPDVIIAQHNKCAYRLRELFPTTTFVYAAHGVLPELEQPPRGIRVDRWTAIHTQVRDHLVRQYVPIERIDIVRDFIDTDLYRPTSKPLAHGGKPRVLFISNYKKWKQYYRLSRACAKLGWVLKAVGAPYGRSRDMVRDINESDIVVSWARGILEGMACGRPVVSYDKELGDGYIDEAMYLESRERNFSGYECRYPFTIDQLAEQLSRLNPLDGERNRSLIEEHHSVVRGVDAVLANVDAAMRHV